MKPISKVLFFVSFFACSWLGAEASQRPNIIVIVVDDLGYADLSFLPQAPADVKKVKTPAIDKIAKSGTYFSNAYATAPICSPSRTGLITGKYQQRWGNYWYNEGGLPADEFTLPQVLKTAGYATKKIGKTHLNGGPVEYPTDHGFDEFLGFLHHSWDYIRLSEKDVEAYRKKGATDLGCQVIGPLVKNANKEKVSYENGFTTEIFTQEAIEYIQRERGDTPFYIQLEYNAVHQPTYVVPEKYANQFGIPFKPFDRNAEKWEYPYWEPTDEPHTEFHKKWGHMGEVDPYGRKAYLAQLKALDDNIGELYKSLKKAKKLENTILVFLSDNGGTINTFANNAPLRGYKYMFGEGGIRIPMIVSYPKSLPKGQTNNCLVSAMDIFPTLLDLTETSKPVDLDGKSLLNVLGTKKAHHHASLCWAKGQDDTWVVRQGNWKLINNGDWQHSGFSIENGQCIRAEDYTYPGGKQLFNLNEDIGETINLAHEYPNKVQEMTRIYETWQGQMSGPCTSAGKLKKKKND
ncbi:sulfatase family protein [Labilibacter marinus]|uniref:sulfatase family protein n=1 Tax=Labilibacter marinus TaxID=1477105 RepID=UPI0009502E54|nr:sulfatase-like hydrolase/transferase [Labilibacter marinus]